MSDKRVYREAVRDVNNLVEEAFYRCEQIAEEKSFELSWVIERFSEKVAYKAKKYKTP